MIQEPLSTPCLQVNDYQFQIDIDIKMTKERPLFQSTGKKIYRVEWINRRDSPIVLLEMNGPTANYEASLYIRFSNYTNIIKSFGRVRNNANSVMILQERSPRADLSEMLQANEFKPTEKVLCAIFLQICDAMIVLVNNYVVHGDLACRNILVFKSHSTEPQKNLVKLTDFGLSRDLRDPHSANSTPTFIPIRCSAPEVFRTSNKLRYSEKSDIYSMGVLMWEACSNCPVPYSSLENDDDVRQRILNGERLPRPSLCSVGLWAIINQCWHKKPQDRPTFHRLKERLSNLDFQSISE